MKKTKRFLAALLILLCTSCISLPPNMTTTQTYAAPAKKISISKKNVVLEPGKTVKLKLKNTKKKPKWTTSSKKVATVSNSGKVTAKKAGTATITAKLDKKSYKCKITVKSKPIKGSVWISATGKKYHRINNCGRMNPDNAKKISLSEAKEKGFSPCTKCF